MLTYDIRNCNDCKSLPDLLSEMDMEITLLSKVRRQNERFDINCNINKDDLDRLIIYRRILSKIYQNSCYISCSMDLASIISKIKTMISVRASDACVFNKTSTTTTTTTIN
jgi:hypothetical protein